jgi:hypothetical protein
MRFELTELPGMEELTWEEKKELRGAILEYEDADGKPVEDDLLLDHEADVYRYGEFLLIAQSLDGHGVLYVVKKK